MNLNIKINEAYCVLNTLENTPPPSIIYHVSLVKLT